ncbi:MAG: S8 family serine peptidase [Bacteroidales bacterium]|nr:S8 family serine peptidase [Bacteroidales bacterium]
MKRITILIWPILLFVLLGCADIMDPSGAANDILVGGTKSPASDYYYWYEGRRIDLIVNEDYVNILVDTNIVNKSNFSELCSEMGVEAKTDLDSYGLFKAMVSKEGDHNLDYQKSVDVLRADSRILKVLPYFERGHGAEPIGTSHFFYVQLKNLSNEDTPYLEREYDVESLQEESERLGTSIVKGFSNMPDWYIMSIEGSEFKTAVDAANCFLETGRFEAIDPAFMFNFRPSATNDPNFYQQWGLKNTTNPGYDINVEGAWSISTGSGINIAIVDQGPDPTHSDLESHYSSLSYNAQTNTVPANYVNYYYHGTQVAGIAAAVGNNGNQIAGVAYDSWIMRVSHDLDFFNPLASSQLAYGINWAWINNADVINNSWGDQGGFFDIYSSILESAIANALDYGRSNRGSVVVFASGNYGIMDYPANSDDRIIAVGSVGPGGYRSSFSGYGPELDVVAPGEQILTLKPGSQLDTLTGTSAAAPHVSGVAALILAVNPYLSNDEVAGIIQFTANKISPGSPSTYTYGTRSNYMFSEETWNQEVGCGLVDATAAVSFAQALSTIPSINDTGMDVELLSGPIADHHSATINGGYFPESADILLMPPLINSAYSYYWRVSTASYPNWHPSLQYTYGSHAVVSIPQPPSSSTLYIQCFVFNGSTLVDVPSFTFTVNPY